MGRHSYLIRTVQAGDTLEMFKTQSVRYGDHSTHAPRQKPTPPEMEHTNHRNAQDRLRQLINENFCNGDFHAVFTYLPARRPPDAEAATKEFRAYLRRVRRALAKVGATLRYVYVPPEVGSRGAIHHHAVIGKADTALLLELWKQNGKVTLHLLYSDGQYGNLGAYILKQTEGVDASAGHRFVASRNLRKPRETVRRVSASTWRKNPPCPKGYYPDPDFPVENGVCVVTGCAYQRCGFRRVPPAKGKKPRIRPGAAPPGAKAPKPCTEGKERAP